MTSSKLGVNLGYYAYWGGSRPFMNLIYGTDMQANDGMGHTLSYPNLDVDAQGWVKSLPAGYQISRGLSVPAAGGDIICRYQGNGVFGVHGPVSNVTTGAGYIRFTINPTYPNPQWTNLQYTVDPTNYVRNLDCREASAPTTDEFAPEFLNSVKGFGVLRFVKWTPSVEANTKNITWATRNKKGDADYTNNDGVPIEVMVDLANQTNADPWFTIPWNADNDYITRMATYVRDNLAPGRRAYVEVSNEVWNYGYPVATQAHDEAIAEGLVSAEDPTKAGSNGERYAEKTKQVMTIWSNVFSGQMSRVVRVMATQNVQPYWSDLLLKYMDTYKVVDALATAPYFGYDYKGTETADQIFAALTTTMADAMNYAVQNKAVAQKYGIRYVSYEGGQSLDFPNNPTLLKQMQQDPRMGTMYNTYLSGWQSQIGDLMTLFDLEGGSWGLVYYDGQPSTETPKMNTVKAILGLSTTTASVGGTTTTTQVCADGSVIPLTSTCPTSSPTPVNGKRNGYGKGGKTGVA
ncbi:MAG: hypothetical protein ACJ8FT_07195 [Sphingomonas sp.]